MKVIAQETNPDPGYNGPMRHKPTGEAGVIIEVEYNERKFVKSLTMQVAGSSSKRMGPVTDFEELMGEERQQFFDQYPQIN